MSLDDVFLRWRPPWLLIFPSGADQPLVIQATLGIATTTILLIVTPAIWSVVFAGMAM